VFFGAHVVNQDPELRDDALGTTGRKIYLNGIQGSYNLVASGAFMGFKAVLQLDNSRRVAPQMWFNGGTTAAELYEQVRAVSADQYPGDKSDNLIGRIAYTLPFKAVQATLYARMSRFMWSFHPIFSNADEVVATGFTLSTKLWSERITINSGGEAGMSNGLGAYNTPVATEKFDIHWLGPDHSEKPRGFNGFANAYLQVRAEVYKGLKLLAGGRLDTFHFIKIGSATDSAWALVCSAYKKTVTVPDNVIPLNARKSL